METLFRVLAIETWVTLKYCLTGCCFLEVHVTYVTGWLPFVDVNCTYLKHEISEIQPTSYLHMMLPD